MRILFISDLHLNEGDPATTERFHWFMRESAPGSDQLYVMGDLFHAWLGDAQLAYDPFAQSVVDEFARLAQGRTRIFFIHGNRDFMLGAQFAKACGGKMLNEQEIIQLGSERALILHGDELCTDDLRYQRARRILRSRAFKAFGNRLPQWVRREIAARLRRASKAHKAGSAMTLLDANSDAIDAAFTRHGVALMIHGHTHRPTDETRNVDGNAKRRIVLSDWQQDYGFLEWIDGTFFVRPWASAHGAAAGSGA